MILYRLFATIAAPVLLAMGLWRVACGRETWADLGQRLGLGAGHPGALWLHGASNGELASARRLILALRAAFPERALLITCNTVSARDMVRGWWLDGVNARLAPVDLWWVLRGFRARWQPAALIMLENEIWPNRITGSLATVIVVSARMSKKSAAAWRRFTLLRRVLARIDRLYPQDVASGVRLVALGLPEDRLGPVARLKSGVSQVPPDPDTLHAMRAVFVRAQTILAASTHEGDEALILKAFAAARATRPDLRLILAPRHPRRSAEVAALIRETGLPFAVRTQTGTPGPDCAVYLADTLGEMPLWYALAGTTIVGGSFSDRGGHTPFEPAQFGSALIHGPDVANFTESYAALRRVNGACEVGDADGLTRALLDLAEPAAQKAQAARAEEGLSGLDDSTEAIDRIITDLKRRIGLHDRIK